MTAAVGVPTEFVAPMRRMPIWPAFEGAAHTLAYDGALVAENMAGEAPSPERWVDVKMRTLVIDGGTTQWLSDGADALGAVLPNVRRRTIPGQQHDIDPAALAPVLIEFFQED